MNYSQVKVEEYVRLISIGKIMIKLSFSVETEGPIKLEVLEGGYDLKPFLEDSSISGKFVTRLSEFFCPLRLSENFNNQLIVSKSELISLFSDHYSGCFLSIKSVY